MVTPRAAGSAPRRPRASGAAPRRSATPVIHQLKEVTTPIGGKATIRVLCGLEGRPYMGGGPGSGSKDARDDGIRSTIWPSDVTCPDCIAQPALAIHPAHVGMHAEEIPGESATKS